MSVSGGSTVLKITSHGFCLLVISSSVWPDTFTTVVGHNSQLPDANDSPDQWCLFSLLVEITPG